MSKATRAQRKIFNSDEKNLIVNFIRNNKNILENKNNDVNLIKAKKQKWEELSQIFAVKGYDRDPHRLREYYHRMKCNAKHIIQAYQKHIKNTGNLPRHVPSELDWAIYEISPEDFNSNDEENSNDDVDNAEIKPMEVSYYSEENNEESESGSLNNQSSIDLSTSQLPVRRKRRYSFSTNRDDFLKKNKTENLPYGFVQIANIELQFLKQKQKMDLALHREQLECIREKHKKDLENINLLKNKLRTELEAAEMSKVKIERETKKVDLEMELLERKLNNL